MKKRFKKSVPEALERSKNLQTGWRMHRLKDNLAVVRRPGSNFAGGITSAGLGKPDYEKALEQHRIYCETLNRCGLELIILDPDERYPDGCFVEDTAVVTEEVAVITRPGAISRRGEEEEIAGVLSHYRKIERIVAPGTLDGGDILRDGNHFFIGLSGRTNSDGAAQLAAILVDYGYTVSEVVVSGGLHLKSGIACLGENIFAGVKEFSAIKPDAGYISIDSDESYAANCLQVNDFLLIAAGFPNARERLRESGYNII